MFTPSPVQVPPGLVDWHEVADLRGYTVLSEAGRGGLTDHLAALSAYRDAVTAQIWQTVALLMDQCPHAEREFLADEIAGALNVHPDSARGMVVTALEVHDNPVLLEALRRGEITERHVLAALKVLVPALPFPVRDAVARTVIERFRLKGEQPGQGWPTPGALTRALRKELLRHDPAAADKREKDATDRRGVGLSPLPDGQAMLTLEGPAPQVFAMHDALLRQTGGPTGPDDTRSADARAFDTARDLLTGAGVSGAAGVAGAAAGRGAGPREALVIVPFSTATDGDLELADLPGYGPILPSTARDLLHQADRVRRVCLDARTGAVLAVDDAIPLPPMPTELPDGTDPAAHAAATAATAAATAAREAALQQALQRMATDPVVLRDLSTPAYRPTLRLLRHIRLRDRACVFPGCTRPATGTDADHRIPWPRGATDPSNTHCLCRHHHRAKQALFTVTTEPDGTTVWTSRATGKTYRRPPHDW